MLRRLSVEAECSRAANVERRSRESGNRSKGSVGPVPRAASLPNLGGVLRGESAILLSKVAIDDVDVLGSSGGDMADRWDGPAMDVE